MRSAASKPLELDPDHHAAAAHLARRSAAAATSSSSQRRSSALFGADAVERSLLLEDLERRQRRRTGERVAGVGVAVEEGLELLVLAEEALVDALGRERRRERQVAARQALRDGHEVGRDALVLAREHRPGAAEAGRDLVADQEHVVLVAEMADVAQVAVGSDEDARGALDERLDDHRGDAVAVLARARARGRRRRPSRPGSSSNSSGRYMLWNISMPPTETEPIVSPW